jgi:hypothetical protein
MSLDETKLEKVKRKANGVTLARCPACGENGGDRKGEHLQIYSDGSMQGNDAFLVTGDANGLECRQGSGLADDFG